MASIGKGQYCAQPARDAQPMSELDNLLCDFLCCDLGYSSFDSEKARRLRAILRRDREALQRLVDLLLLDKLVSTPPIPSREQPIRQSC